MKCFFAPLDAMSRTPHDLESEPWPLIRARAFYTEGKSLLYYAYDFPHRKADAGKFSYLARDETNGNKASIKKIGLLFHDDQT
jgi:hypothetical protein